MQISTRLVAALFIASALSTPALAQSGAASFAVSSASTEVTRSPETGLVEWMSGVGGQAVARANAAVAGASYEQAARAFLSGQSTAFGLSASNSALVTTRTEGDEIGRTFVRFQQTYKGVPILAADLNVQMDAARNVRSVNAKSVDDLNLSVVPSVTAADARRIAFRSTARRHEVSQVALSATAPSLAIHDARLMGGRAAPPRLVWRVDVTSATHLDIRELVLVDAQNGRVAVQFNQTPNVAPASATQRICNANNTAGNAGANAGTFPCTAGKAIVNPAGSSFVDVRNAFKFSENTYDFFARRFDRNSLNGTGFVLISTVRYCKPSATCPYANAFWNSTQMTYGAGFAAADDVVAHELTHGFTEFTSNLFYFYQSGAINESLSDIIGEFVDLTNGAGTDTAAVRWLSGEDVPGFGAGRSLKNPPAAPFLDPDRMQSPLYTKDASFDDNGGVHTNSGVGNKTAFLMTEPGAKTFNGQTVTGLGIDKSAAIWFRTARLILQSGSDYADLGKALTQACKDLTGTTPKNAAGGPSAEPITAANCTEVAQAVLATELAKAPLVNPIPAESPVCASNQVVGTTQLFEKFEVSPLKFGTSPLGAWGLIVGYAASNTRSVELYSPNAADAYLLQFNAITVPGATNVTPYLRFAHYHNMTSVDGGVVEYQIGSGPWTAFSQSEIANNPYNAIIPAGSGTALAGKRAFSGFSGGFTSTRIRLMNLRGDSIKVRFRGVASNAAGFLDWIIDDIRIYTCKAAPTIALN